MIMMKVDKSLLAGLLATVLGLTGTAIPLPEHPRPDWERPQWVNLNGEWDFGFEEGVYDRKILVPFAWGAPLSGVKDPDPRKAMTGRYRRFVTVPDAWRGKRVFVVVGAADHDTTCWFAGERLGGHSGGYTPFEFELTKFVRWGERQELQFDVWDGGNDPKWWMSHHLMGKQGYGNARGIWQTVYLEVRGDDYLESVRFHPDVKRGSVRACLKLAEPVREARVATVAVAGQKAVEVPFAAGEREKSVDIALVNPRLWTLDDPHLYDVTLKLGDDEVKSYFGLREIGTGFLPGTDFRYVTLNGKPVYLRMTLDQSHHPEGYCTLPSDEAMRNDILISKRLALTGNRIHLKVEQPRKLYWADKLGLLIQADVPCAYGPATDESFRESRACLEGMVGRDFNHPSIYQWTLYNETLGLFEDGGNDPKDRNARYLPWIRREVAESYRKAKALDPTRLVEDNSACNRDHVVTDVNSWHDYKPGYGWEALVRAWCDASFVGSTNNYIGGCRQGDVPMMNSECGNVWGYRGFTGDVDQSWDYHWMMNAFRRNPKCCGWLYTEHHDVINEWNGYVRYDRSPKYAGWEELFPGMTTADLHGEVYPVLDPAFFRTAAPGETWRMPVSISVMGERWAGRTLSVRRECRWWDGCGRLHVTDGKDVIAFDCKAWQQGFLAEDAITLPSEPAAGVVAYSVRDGETVVGRNFAPFAVRRRDDDGRVVVSKSSWSRKSSAVLDGLKVNGMGKGFFELELDAPAEGGMFRAELSSRPLYAKDVEAGDANLSDTDIAFGGKGRLNPMSNANSYRMTSEECHASGLRIFANGKLVRETVLTDDPCDHRGLLSWMAQPQDFRLREAGTYGELVEARIPAEAVKNGKVTIRLEADDGLAIYGSRFGRYPLGPSVSPSGR